MIDFPSSPIDGQQYTYDKRSWEWSEAKNAWLLVPVSTADADYAAIKAAEANLSAVAAKASEDIAETAAAESLASELAAAASASSAAGAVLGTPLTGLSTSSNTEVSATDVVLAAFGKLQAQASALLTAIGLLSPKADPTFTGTVSGVTAAMVGLDSVNNTSDASKPVSTAQAAAINTAKTTLELNTQTGTTYTLDLDDAGKRVSMSNAAANELTVPPNSAAAFPLNTIIYVSQDGAGATSIAAGAGVTINTAEGLKVGGQYKMVSLIKTATDTWLGIGSIA